MLPFQTSLFGSISRDPVLQHMMLFVSCLELINLVVASGANIQLLGEQRLLQEPRSFIFATIYVIIISSSIDRSAYQRIDRSAYARLYNLALVCLRVLFNFPFFLPNFLLDLYADVDHLHLNALFKLQTRWCFDGLDDILNHHSYSLTAWPSCATRRLEEFERFVNCTIVSLCI